MTYSRIIRPKELGLLCTVVTERAFLATKTALGSTRTQALETRSSTLRSSRTDGGGASGGTFVLSPKVSQELTKLTGFVEEGSVVLKFD
jgi:hypothetical protein